jgi:hypothetical protein
LKVDSDADWRAGVNGAYGITEGVQGVVYAGCRLYLEVTSYVGVFYSEVGLTRVEIILFWFQIHLVDIDIPNGIRFNESEALSPGANLLTFDIGVFDFFKGRALPELRG